MKIFTTLILPLLALFYSVASSAEIKFKINGADGDAEDNIEIYLDNLDAPKNANDDDYLSEVVNSTQTALRVFGFYQSSVDITVTDKSNDQLVTLDIVVGPVTVIDISDIELKGAGKDLSDFKQLIETFELSKGDPLLHANYESAKGGLKSIARRYGFFDATFEKARVDVSSLTNSANVYLWFNTGPRYLFGELLFDAPIVAEKNIISLRSFEVGDPFDTRKLGFFNSDLNETGYFKSISILPDFNEKDGLQVPLNVVASMQPEDSFNAGFGYSTDEGIRGKFRWVRPWVTQWGHSVEGNVVASIPKQEASLTYKIPLEDPIYNYMSVQTGYKLVEQNDTDTTQFLVGFSRHWRFSNQWERTAFIRYEHEQGLQGQEDFSTSLIIPGVSFSRTRTKGGINATWGDRLMTSLEVSNEWWLSSDDLIKIYGQAKYLRTYSGHQFVGSIELGAIQTSSIYNVPSSMRFFTGGDQSVRGFGYESIAPEDDDGYLLGGKYLTVASLEYRFPVADNWKIALFSDIGTATDDFSEVMSSSAGMGVVWASPVGPVRLYVAKPITNEIDSFAIHFMIGPEL
ncbi:outer membrane protein assembly factor [Psychromonas marina]|uniref:Translocation and assembly module subunit TamA n=1 Tax=Psychromonas marina TaxID=88364 RepID=A0ABQ6E268_9GAMM|nr:autotransporter assembly complex family protein [Psychromonas marina]GLS91273.1 outer membrane protein assembly factor [Psychromonas marina]